MKSDEQDAEINRVSGGLYATVEDVPDDALIAFKITGGGRAWSSDSFPVNTVRILMAEDQ